MIFSVISAGRHPMSLPLQFRPHNRAAIRQLMSIGIISFIFLTVPLQVLFAVPANSQPIGKVQVNIELKNETLISAFQKIEAQSPFHFMYRYDEVKDIRNLRVPAARQSVEALLKILFAGTSLTYRQVDNRILITSSPEQKRLKTPELSAVNEPFISVKAIIRGQVTNVKGEPLSGVSITLKGNTTGTTSDNLGSYAINVPDNGTLVFSFVGYTAMEVNVGDRTTVNVTLQDENKTLGDVVVVGYGTQRKKDITGAIASVPTERFRDQPVSNVEQALKGQVAGVQVSQNSGSPSAGVNIKIRGTSSITAGNEPLFVIDGFPVSAGDRGQGAIANGNPLNTINPNDIESIDILKDASATAIYGSRGSNGVVIITTKSGKAGKPKISFDAFTGFQNLAKKVDVLNAAEMAELHIESRNNGWLQSGGNPAIPNANRGRFTITPFWSDQTKWNPTDWQDQIFRPGYIQNYNLTATGGNENIRYALSGGYFTNKGIVINSDLKRYSFRSNIDAKLSSKIKAGFKFSPSYTINNQIRSEGDFNNGLVHQSLLQIPNFGPYDSTGYGGYSNQNALRTILGQVGALGNPVARAREDKYQLNQGRVLGNAFLEWEITTGLRFRTMFGVDAALNRTHVFNSSINALTGAAPSTIPSGSASSSEELDLLNENLLTYETTIKDDHRISAIAGYSAQRNDFKFISTAGTQYPNDNIQYVSAAGIITGGTEQRSQWSMLSYYGRVNYSFADRYLLTGTLRRDGSSRFGSNRKYGNFPSAAIGWRISEEKFMRGIGFINDLKIRASYGISGNNSIGNYTHLANTANAGYVTGATQVIVNGFQATGLGNQDLTWETKRSYNFGLDLSVADNRINLTAEYYKANTNGLLLSVNIPAVAGFTTRNENIGEVENKGVELSLNTRNLTGAFKWNSNFNISFNRNKILALGGSAGDFIDGRATRNIVGFPMSRFYQRVTDGIFNSQQEIDKHVPQDNQPKPGDRRFKDVNGDGKVDNNDRDFVGDPNPSYTFGATNTLSYKGFEVNILINGSYGNDIYYNTLFAASNLNGNLNNNGLVRNRWRSPDNPGTGNIPKALFGFPTLPDVGSDFYVFDGSFLRISNFTLAYNLPETVITKTKLNSARLYISAQNVHTFTSYPGFDPENAIAGGSLNFGFDDGIYPVARVISLGINLAF